jgi:hypothetical protein
VGSRGRPPERTAVSPRASYPVAIPPRRIAARGETAQIHLHACAGTSGVS